MSHYEKGAKERKMVIVEGGSALSWENASAVYRKAEGREERI